jgi:hypothetical protein
MRTILILCALILAGAGVFTWRALRTPTRFGTFNGAPTVEVAALVDSPKSFLGKAVAVNGIVREQCKAMGCFFSLVAGSKTLRVELQDIAMTAPMREGHPARIEGHIFPYGDAYQLVANAVEFK